MRPPKGALLFLGFSFSQIMDTIESKPMFMDNFMHYSRDTQSNPFEAGTAIVHQPFFCCSGIFTAAQQPASKNNQYNWPVHSAG